MKPPPASMCVHTNAGSLSDGYVSRHELISVPKTGFEWLPVAITISIGWASVFLLFSGQMHCRFLSCLFLPSTRSCTRDRNRHASGCQPVIA